MSARDWIVLGVGFLISAALVLAVGFPIIASYMPGQTTHERNAKAGRALQIPGGFLVSVGIFALTEPQGIVRAAFSALPIVAISLIGFWPKLARHSRNVD